MNQYRQCFTYISIITGMFFISAYNPTFFLRAEASSQSTATVCDGGGSCSTVTCHEGRTCYTYQSQPSPTITQQSPDPPTVQQPPTEDSHYLPPQPLEGGTDFQPLEEEAGTAFTD
jgi:hypothetical protein